MRLVVQLTAAELLGGKPVVLGVTGADQVTIHFDPADEDPKVLEPEKVQVEREPVQEDVPEKNDPLWCDHCKRRFQSREKLSRHQNYLSRYKSTGDKVCTDKSWCGCGRSFSHLGLHKTWVERQKAKEQARQKLGVSD